MWRAMLAICCLAALVACGGPDATATSTVTPTATATLPPTVTPTLSPTRVPTATPTFTPAPTATATATRPPTATATRVPSATPTVPPDFTARDASNLCQVTLPGTFRDDGGIWRVGNEAGVTLVGVTAGFLLDFDAATQLLTANIGTQVGDYRETGRTREATDRLRITYTGRVFDVPGGGIIYQRQFGQNICAVILFAASGQESRYAPVFERIIASFGPAR
jgi:hypothetical protein